MKNSLMAFFVSMIGFGFASADIQTLGPVHNLSTQEGVAAVKCDNIADKLVEAYKIIEALGNNVVSSTNDVARVMSSWHATLSRYEGQTVRLAYGFADPIHQSANVAAQNAMVFQQDFSSVNTRLLEILSVYRSCLK